MHEYDYAIKGNHLDRNLIGSYVRIAGNLAGGNSLFNYSIDPISITPSTSAITQSRKIENTYSPSTLGFDKTYKLTGEIRSGAFEIPPEFKQNYYFIHLTRPVTFDSKGAQGILLRQYDIGINFNRGKLDTELGTLVGKIVSIEGTVGFSVEESGSPDCCSLSISIHKINR